MKDRTTSPTGRNGKPIILPPMSFDDAVRKMLSTEPPKGEAKPTMKPVRLKG